MNKNNKKIIFTIDFDAFFSSCEELKNPLIKNEPIVIGKGIQGEINLGVITTANYKARKYGFHAGQPLYKVLEHNNSKKEKIKIVEPDFEFYSKISSKSFNLIKTFSDQLQVSSIDECYIDVTKIIESEHITPIELAKKMQKVIFEQIGITASFGISNNILLSKMGSNLKKPNGISTLFPSQIKTKLWNLPIENLYGAGYSISLKLRSLGVETIGDFANLKLMEEKMLTIEDKIGKKALELHNLANGISSDIIENSHQDSKSISYGRTFSHILDEEEIKEIVRQYSKIITKKLEARNYVAGSVFLKYKNSWQKGHAKKQFKSIQRKLKEPTNKTSVIWSNIINIYEELKNKDLIHLTVGVSKIENNYLLRYKQKKFDGFSIKENKSREKHSIEKIIIEEINLIFNKNILVDLNELTYNKKYNKQISKDDRIKFKVWDEE